MLSWEWQVHSPPNSIQIQSAILPQYTFPIDRQTDRHQHMG